MITYKRTILLFLFAITSIQALKGQDVEVQLSKKGYSREGLAVRALTDTLTCKNVPFKIFPYKSLRRVAIDPTQASYERVIDGKMDQKNWVWFANEYKLDTSRISKTKVVRNYVHVASGIDANGIKYVSVDANNNRDFSDDKIFSFDLKSSQKNYPEIMVSIDYFDGQLLKSTNIPIMIDAYGITFPSANYPNKTDKDLDLTIFKLYQDYSGKLKIGKEEYNISVVNQKQCYELPNFFIEVQKVEPIVNSFMKFAYTSKDTISIRYRNYMFKEFQRGKLKLTYVGSKSYAGAELNTPAPPIEEVELIKNSSFSLKKNSGKYILIDFWGSWCNPCIKAIPDLKKAYEQFKGKVEFVSIAYDKLQDKKKLENLINQNNMTWHHVFDNMEAGKQSISNAYKVQEFPTTILVDPKGNVVFRSVAKEGLESASQYLTTIFKGK
ncbi:TlpA disulfide reductase family protein [Pedobacter sp. Du54]|uniref:TlpA family protein disulfide reductase n=1 Tax=Pedobacter anseongensis TaxID=3133439 RepID=UPI0030A6B799